MKNLKQRINNLPAEILALPRFVNSGNGGDPKAPFEGWNLPEKQKLYSELNGIIGVVASTVYDNSLIFFDFDHVLNEAGEFVNQDAEKWFNYLQAGEYFCELSQSGTGLHMFAAPSKGKFTKGRRQLVFDDGSKIEIFYGTNKFCLVTGNSFRCQPNAPIAQGLIADEMFQNLLNAIQKQLPQKKSPAPMDYIDITDYDTFRAEIMLNRIVPADLADSDWLAVISACKNIGIPYNVVDAFNRRDPDRYHEKENIARWNSLENSSFDISTLHGIAKRFGYDEKSTWHEFHKKNPTDTHATESNDKDCQRSDKNSAFDEQINSWRENNRNAPVDTNVIVDVNAAYHFLNDVTLENISASMTFDISTRRKVALCKFYTPKIAQKFFGILKAAQKNATEKIKKLRAQKPTPDIPPELQELADLKIGDFSKAVDEFFNQIKKDQKNFTKKYKQEQEKREGDAKRKAFLENRLSTKKIMPDCPVDLFLPDDVYFSAHEVGTQTFTQNGNVITKTAAKSPIVPIRILREPKKRTTQYEIAIKAKGIWGFIEVDGEEIADTKKVLRLATDGGALIKDARQLCNYLTEMIAANEDILTETKCYQQTGWLNGKFDKFIYPTGSDDYKVRCDKFNFEEAYASQGDADAWKKVFIQACNEGGAVTRAFLGNPLCAPLVAPIELPNLQTHLIGAPDCGKSGLIKLAASIFGNPSLLKRSFASTIKNRQRIAAINPHLPTFLDELGTVHGGKQGEQSLAQMVYDYFEGINNQINSRDGTVKEMFTFSGTRVSAAEHEMLKPNDAQGAFKRLLQLHCPKQLFSIKFAKKLHSFTKYNFGHYGKAWTDYITTHQCEINRKLQSFFDDCLKISPDALDKWESTLVINVVASCLATQFFLVSIGAKTSFDDAQFIHDVDELLLTLPTIKDIDEAERARERLASFIQSRRKFFEKEIEDNSVDGFTEISSASYESYGKECKNGEFLFYTVALEKILEIELGFASASAIIKKFARKNWLICGKGRNLRCNVRIHDKSTPVYRFKAGVLWNKDSDSDKSKSISA